MPTPRARTSPRKRGRQERSRATIEAILAAAARILAREGYDRTTTAAIAELAGVSIGSLYQYFPAKEAIVAELIDRHVEKMFALIGEEVAGLSSAPLREAVRRVVALLSRAQGVDGKLRRVFIEQVPRFGRLEKLRALDQRLTAAVRAYLEAHRAEVRRRDLDLAAFVVMRTVAAVTYAGRVERPGADPEKLVDELTDLVVAYLT